MQNIQSAKSPVIALKTAAKEAELVGVAAMVLALRKAGAKKIIILTENETGVGVIKKLAGGEIEVVKTLPAKKFLISFKKDGSEVENVQWQQDDAAVKLYVTLASGKLSLADMRLESLGGDFDVLILPAIKQLSELGTIAEKNASVINDIKILGVGADLNLGDKYNYSSIYNSKLSTFAEQVFKAIGEQLDAPIAQLLVTGIMLETKNLTQAVISSEIFLTMKKLVDAGARLEKIESTISQTKAN